MIQHKLIIDCWEVSQPDGGGIDNEHVAYFTTEKIADEFIRITGKGWPKYKERIQETISYNICESVAEYADQETIAKREKALAKLTKDEKKLLGLI